MSETVIVQPVVPQVVVAPDVFEIGLTAPGPQGIQGIPGETGATGAQGPSGVVAVDGTYITNSGTSTSANLSFVPSALTIAQSQVTGLVSALAGKAALTASQTFIGVQTVQTSAATSKGLIVKGTASQSVNLMEFQDSTGGIATVFNAVGQMAAFRITAGSNTVNATYRMYAVANSATDVVSVVRGAASQSVNLQEWQNSAGSILANVGSLGGIVATSYSTTNGWVSLTQANSGGALRLTRATATSTPAASTVSLQVIAGTTGSKLVAVGPAGTAYTILDNIV